MKEIHNPTPEDIKELGRVSLLMHAHYTTIMDDPVLREMANNIFKRRFES